MASASIALPFVFNGRTDVEDWVERFILCATANGWNPESRAAKLPVFLEGEALNVYRELTEQTKQSADATLAALKKAFAPVDACGTFLRAYDRREWREGESPRNFLFELRRLLRRAIPDLDKGTEESLVYQRFLCGLPMDIANAIRTSPDCRTAASAADRASILLAHRRPAAAVSSVEHTAVNSTASSTTPTPVELRLAQVEHELQQLRLAAASLTGAEPLGDGTVSALAAPESKRRHSGASTDYRRKGVRCYECSGYGHTARFCANRRPDTSREADSSRQPGRLQNSGNGQGAPARWGAGGRL